jgi:hypothetical protein
MSIVKDILRDERDRLSLLKDQIENEIGSLPKGSLSRKKRSNRFFFYLFYREGDKVIFKYVGKEDSPKVRSLEKDIKKRRKLEQRLREIKVALKNIRRGLSER